MKKISMKKQLLARVEYLEAENQRLKADGMDFEIRLDEARRRTIPVGYPGHQDAEVNFLPLFIERIEIKHDTFDIQSRDRGLVRDVVIGSATATIVARGDTIRYQPYFDPKRG